MLKNESGLKLFLIVNERFFKTTWKPVDFFVEYYFYAEYLQLAFYI